jgi:NAD(P)-dependent dehydrogenase (short-subunit alcohol dehydrogenase family)
MDLKKVSESEVTITRVAIITGAAGGIGSATARSFGAQGYHLVLTDADAGKLGVLKNNFDLEGISAVCFTADLSDHATWDQVIAFALESFGRIDVLVNNAAWRVPGSLRTTTLPDWEKTLRVCLTAPVFLAKASAAVMEKQYSGGVIVNISSVMADRPSGLATAYIAAKGALDSLTKELAITYGRKGIRVVGVAPGYIETELSNDYTDPEGENISATLTAQLTDFIPLGRGGSPEEVAKIITWVCSEDASYLTGTTLLADGGFQPNFNPYSTKNIQFPDEF